MNNERANYQQKDLKRAHWIDVVWYLSDTTFLNPSKLQLLTEQFGTVTVCSSESRPEMVDASIRWEMYEEEEFRSETWNRVLRNGKNNWVLYLVDEEEIRLSSLDTEYERNTREWPAALIIDTESDKNYQFYQMRLVHVQDGFMFDGVHLADCSRFMSQQGIGIATVPIEILAKKNPNAHVDIDQELKIKNYSPQLYLEGGYRLYKAKKYILSAAQYRMVANLSHTLPFDRLAALNGISGCYAEMFKWEQALATAEKSIQEDAFQNLPFLIKFKVSQLNKQWEEAYSALHTYYENTHYERIKLHSKANYDVKISVDETLLDLIDLALKAGFKQEASDHLEELFNLKEGNLEDSFIRQLLVLSIELSDFDKSEFYFKKLFAGKFPENCTDAEIVELNDYMEMFMKQNWYESVYQVYSELHFKFPQNDEFRRRLIVTLVKTKRVEQARNLATKVA